MMKSRVKVLVLPVFRRYWLWHAWTDQAAEAGAAKTVANWKEGVGLEEKLQLLGTELSQRVRSQLPLLTAAGVGCRCSTAVPKSLNLLA